MSYIASLFSKSNARRYSFASYDDETSDVESRSFLPEKQPKLPKSFLTWHLVVAWTLSTVSLAFLAVYFDRRSVTPATLLGTFETGWKTDFGKYHSSSKLGRIVITMKQNPHESIFQQSRFSSRAAQLLMHTATITCLIRIPLHMSESRLQKLIEHGKY